MYLIIQSYYDYHSIYANYGINLSLNDIHVVDYYDYVYVVSNLSLMESPIFCKNLYDSNGMLDWLVIDLMRYVCYETLGLVY